MNKRKSLAGKHMVEIPSFKNFEDFFEWIKGLEYETILKNDKRLAFYFESNPWGWPDRVKLANYIKDRSKKEQESKVEEKDKDLFDVDKFHF